MRYVPGNAQHIGSREEQEDSFGFSSLEDSGFVRHGGFVGAVADGMGGLEHGREAGQAAMRAFLRGYGRKQETESIPDALERSVREANESVVQMGRNGGAGITTGSTLVAAALRHRSLYWVSVGDSAVYLWRNRRLTQLNLPHTFARVLRRRAAAGEISREEADRHPDREALTSYLGEPTVPEVDRNRRGFHLKQGDQIVLCTDGIFKTLSIEQMQAAMGDSPQRSSEALVERTLAAGAPHQDNLTVVAIATECEPGDGEPAGERTGEEIALQISATRGVRKRRRVLLLALSGVLLAAVALRGLRDWRSPAAATHLGVDATPLAAPHNRSQAALLRASQTAPHTDLTAAPHRGEQAAAQAAPRPSVRTAPVTAPLAAGSRSTTSDPQGASAPGRTAASATSRVPGGKTSMQQQPGVATKMPQHGQPF